MQTKRSLRSLSTLLYWLCENTIDVDYQEISRALKQEQMKLIQTVNPSKLIFVKRRLFEGSQSPLELVKVIEQFHQQSLESLKKATIQLMLEIRQFLRESYKKANMLVIILLTTIILKLQFIAAQYQLDSKEYSTRLREKQGKMIYCISQLPQVLGKTNSFLLL